MPATFINKIIKFKANTNGIDYVLGDIHGRFDLVKESLKQVSFNPLKDRLFCVGDLIDRGEYSSEIINFIKQPYVYTIRGNHEDMLLEFYELYPEASDDDFLNYGYHNGMSWFIRENLQNRQEILSLLSKLPLIIEIESPRGLIGLVHADIPKDMSWQTFKEQVFLDNQSVINTALWGRHRLNYGIEEDVEGLGRLYVGHTVQNNITKLANVVALDTGAVFDKHLSMVNLTCRSEILKAPDAPKNNLLHLISDDIRPFSKKS